MEKRREPRYPFTCAVEGIPTASHDAEGKTPVVHGTLVDLSNGGACVLTERPLEPRSVLVWRFHFAPVPVPLPVLMEVRSSQPAPGGANTFRLGLSFIV